MKARNFLPLGALGLILASCSSDEPTQNGGSQISPEGTSYLAVNITLPSATSTRAVEYVDGETDEYKVKTAHLLIWEKETGDNNKVVYNFVSATSVGLNPFESSSDSEHTATSTRYFEMKTPLSGDNFYATVLLNAPANLIPAEDSKTTYADWKELEADFAGAITTTGFYMANAPQYDSTNGATSLVQIDTEHYIYPNKEEAIKGKNALNVCVERGVAKVEVNNEVENNSVTLNNDLVKASISLEKWVLDQTNEKGLAILNVTGVATPFGDKTHWFTTDRVFWGKDMNYDKEGNLTKVNETQVNKDFETFAYCNENTTDINRMVKGNLTRVIVKGNAQLTGGDKNANFFTVSDKAISVDDFKKQLEEIAKSIDGVTIKSNIEADLKEIPTKNVPMDALASGSEEALNALATQLGNVQYYVGGACYYEVFVKHFADDVEYKAGQSYGPEHTGRYGVVRNNWYDITVNDITKLGSPVIPNNPDQPVDDMSSYLKYTVKMHSWAKRTQTEKL